MNHIHRKLFIVIALAGLHFFPQPLYFRVISGQYVSAQVCCRDIVYSMKNVNTVSTKVSCFIVLDRKLLKQFSRARIYSHCSHFILSSCNVKTSCSDYFPLQYSCHCQHACHIMMVAKNIK